MSKEMLINVAEGEECRIAVVEDGRLQELYMERTSAASHVGNIYKGRVTNVEASIQAAFVDFGVGRNGFLHVSDLLPTYFGERGDDVEEYVGKKMARRDRPPIQRCLRRGDEIVVQVIKEGIGTKGPTLSSYLSISGKMLVMMPGVAGRGVSKKIEDEDERRRLKRILTDLRPPEDCGFILRTEAVDKEHEDIERDLTYLARLWDQIKRRRDGGPTPVELYTEGDLVTRTVRDVFSADVDRVIVDHPDVADRVRDVIRISTPKAADVVQAYDEAVPLFSRYGIEHEIEQMYSRHVPLPSGGSLVIDSTEAVVTIDVNSGKFRDHSDAEMTAFKTDMEAAAEIPRQLKLRDLGGVVICDFIDLRYERHRRELEETLFDNFKRDRAKTKVLRMSEFGIIELTRQRMRPSLERSIYFDCPHCKGAGLVKTPESMSLDLMRRLAIAVADLKVARAELNVCADVAFHMLNKKRGALADLEHDSGKPIVIKVDPKLGLDEMRFELFDGRDGVVILDEIGMTMPERGHTTQLGNKPPGHTSQARGSRGTERGGDRNGRRPDRPTMEPARALEVDDDEQDELDPDEIARGESAVEEREQSQRPGGRTGGRDEYRRPPVRDREQDRADLPAILETEAGDEGADELADEEIGAGQGDADVAHPGDVDNRGGEPQQGGEGGDGGGRRRRRRRRRGRGRTGEGQPNGDANSPNAPRGPAAFQGGPSRPAEGGGNGDRAPDAYADDYHEPGDANGNVRSPVDDLPDDDGTDYDDEADADGTDHTGAVGTFNDVEPSDKIGPAAEGGDSVVQSDLNDRFADRPAATGGEAGGDNGGEGGGRRRRRRRGGRRHRRRDDVGQPAGSADADVADDQGNDQGNDQDNDQDNDRDDADQADDDADLGPIPATDADAGGVVVLSDADAVPVGTSAGEAAEAEAEADEATAELAAERPAETDTDDDDEADDEPEAEPVAAAPKRAKKTAKKTAAKKAVAKKVPTAAKKATAKKATAKKATAKKPARTPPRPPTTVEPPAGVVSTGTADTHVADEDAHEEPITPRPASRPRSYADLDAIPDDYD